MHRNDDLGSSLSIEREIDRLCDRFESAWQVNSAPEWELDIPGFSETDQCRLFREYLSLDIDYRRGRSQTPTTDEYLSRFPEFAAEIRDIFLDDEQGPDSSDTFLPLGILESEHSGTKSDVFSITDRFSLLRPLTEGGIGKVVVAKDERLPREVAIKQLREGLNTDQIALARFHQEAKLTSRLEHPGIVPVYGMGTDESGDPFYVMRYVQGGTLREAISRLHESEGVWSAPEWNLELRKLLSRFISVCRTIHYAHKSGVVHRDLKPSNILLGEFGETLVVDWGSAKSIDSSPDQLSNVSGAGDCITQELTIPGSLVGTPAYMSPEQAKGGQFPLSPAQDIYSLGATLTILLSGEPSVPGKTFQEVIDNLLNGKVQSPKTILHGIPAALDAICRKCMKQDPQQRYKSPEEIANDLELWLAGEPVSAFPESLLSFVLRELRRHRLATLSLSAVLVIGLGITFLANRRVASEAKRVRLASLIQRTIEADLGSLPEISKSLEPFGNDGRKALEERLANSSADRHACRNMMYLLAQKDSKYLDRLADVLLETDPQEFLVFRNLLHQHAEQISQRLWEKWKESPLSPHVRLRILGTLALFEPDSPEWNSLSESVVELLCREPSVWYGIWHQVFMPVSPKLLPPLRKVFVNSKETSFSHSSAELIGLFGVNAPDQLMEILQIARPSQMEPLVTALKKNPEFSIPLLKAELENLIPVSDQIPVFENHRSVFTDRDKKRAIVAAALLALGRPEDVLPWCEDPADPTFRSWLVELVPHSGIAPEMLFNIFSNEKQSDRRRILLHMLGTISVQSVEKPTLQRWLEAIRETEKSDPDPGIHSSAQWVIHQWTGSLDLQREAIPFSPDRRWYETKSGEGYAILQGPMEFLMGSPQDEFHRDPADELHLQQIGRSYAIASREVTFSQAVRRVPSLERLIPQSRRGGQNISAFRMSWYDAARFCRRLSEEEGIPEDQMCFPPIDQIGPEMTLPDDYFSRTGYRIPTQSEWEYAARAGSITQSFFGDDMDLQDAYLWNLPNSLGNVEIPGLKKPNELGLFDVLGNVGEWCYERCEETPYSKQLVWHRTVWGDLPQSRIAPRRTYMVRGGHVNNLPYELLSANRMRLPAQETNGIVGLRPVRTLPNDWQPFDIIRTVNLPNNKGLFEPPSEEVRYEIKGTGQKFRVEDVSGNVTVHPLSGIAPHTVVVKGTVPGPQPFRFNVADVQGNHCRTVTGKIVDFDWQVELLPLVESPESANLPEKVSESQTKSSLLSPEISLGQSLATVPMRNGAEFHAPVCMMDVKLPVDTFPKNFVLSASANPSLPPGEYFVQIYGNRNPAINVEGACQWMRPLDQPLPKHIIDATLRMSIRDSSIPLKAEVLSNPGEAVLWVYVRPVPTIP